MSLFAIQGFFLIFVFFGFIFLLFFGFDKFVFLNIQFVLENIEGGRNG
jgi:hypothetical protein